MAEIAVAPFMGAWIETWENLRMEIEKMVAPFMGTWIETEIKGSAFRTSKLLPSWKRGLKYDGELDGADEISVAPLVGAWTEII